MCQVCRAYKEKCIFAILKRLKMSAFLQKARNNVVTAEFLIDHDLSVSSAHPAYYSAFLLMKYVLAHFCGKDYAMQDQETIGKDSHLIISEFALPFMVKQDVKTGNDYFVWYNKLKKMRKQADYNSQMIEKEKLTENLMVAKQFMLSIETNFKAA